MLKETKPHRTRSSSAGGENGAPRPDFTSLSMSPCIRTDSGDKSPFPSTSSEVISCWEPSPSLHRVSSAGFLGSASSSISVMSPSGSRRTLDTVSEDSTNDEFTLLELGRTNEERFKTRRRGSLGRGKSTGRLGRPVSPPVSSLKGNRDPFGSYEGRADCRQFDSDSMHRILSAMKEQQEKGLARLEAIPRRHRLPRVVSNLETILEPEDSDEESSGVDAKTVLKTT